MFNIAGNGTGGYNLTNSLRFRSSASAYLSRTPASASNRTTWTWSGWVKRGALTSLQMIFSAGTSASSAGLVVLQFSASDTLQFVVDTGTTSYQLNTTQVFRDPSAWYHIVAVLDTTQATSTNRMKLYLNGSQITAFGTATYPAQNDTYAVNNTQSHNIGRYYFDGTRYFDGYVTEINLIDGQVLTPSSFGSTNSTTGVWQPAKYTGTYGTNGFYLPFTDNSALTTASNAGLGKDFSGNANYWVTNNISITAGATYDSMKDVPTLTSATVANYATFNPLKMPAPASASYTNGNLSVSCATANQTPALATIYPSSGKWYWEVTWTSGSYARIGVQNTTVASTDFAADVYGWRWESNTGNIYNGGIISTAPASYVAGDILGFCLDLDSGKLYVSKNGTWQNSAVPASGTGAVATNIPTATLMSPAVATGSGTAVFAINCGQRPFSYSPPSGFVALNTYNLPTPTILQGNKYMDATLYTGTGANATITNAGGFKPDLVWVKVRSTTGTHVLTDSNRGANKQLFSNLTDAEASSTIKITGFTSTGFTLGADNGTGTGDANFNGSTYVGWQWRDGQGSISSNTYGTITSTVSVNTTAGFSVVTYTGNSTSGATVGHGLGVTPSMIILKSRSFGDTGWAVKHKNLSSGNNLRLNTTAAQGTLDGYGVIADLNSSTTFTLTSGGAGNTNVNNSGSTYVAYCWAEISGYSKAFSYTGNGSTDGSFVYTGFLPRFVLIKRTDTTGDWYMWDTARNTYDVITNTLLANSSAAETSATSIDALSNGFKLRNTTAGFNASGGTYIGMAWATNPFKNSNAF